jgi:hypothetical protein
MPNACGREFAKRDDDVLHCNYCGSISVSAAITFLKQPGTSFSGSDWKYGFPHKFYIEPVNPRADELVPIGFKSGPEISARNGSGPNDKWVCRAHHNDTCPCPRDSQTGFWQEVEYGHHKSLYLKFYTNHLKDATPEEFAEFSTLSEKIFGIKWELKEDGKIFYSCPKTSSFYGYQRAGLIGKDGNPVHRF